MERQQLCDLFDAIKKDDVKSFSFLLQSQADFNICFGRFPILSLLYLYSSFNILKKYEKELMPIHSFQQTEEFFEMYKKFKTMAKKSVRFFEEKEIVYPILMLAVLNQKIILQKCYKMLYKTDEIVEKLNKIYKTSHELEVEISEDVIAVPSCSLTYHQKKLLVLVSVALAMVFVFVSAFLTFVGINNGFGSLSSPILISNEREFVQALNNGNRCYSLTQDLEISREFQVKNFSGTIFGNDHKIKITSFLEKGMIENFSGKMQDVKIDFEINDKKITQNYAIFTQNSTGIIENCEFFGNINATFSSNEDIYAGVIVSNNNGIIKNCNVKISADVLNEQHTNAFLGLVAGKNDEKGIIENCVTIQNGNGVFADTVDLAGIAAENYGEIKYCENNVELSQISQKEWHPNVAGIAINNYNIIIGTKNTADISSISTLQIDNNNYYYVYAGGIVCENSFVVSNCLNTGAIVASSKISHVFVGGIASQNVCMPSLLGSVDKCLSKCDIEAKSETGLVCVGGIAGYNSSGYNEEGNFQICKIENSGFIGTIDADTNSQKDSYIFTYSLSGVPINVEDVIVLYAGGIVGYNNSADVKNCYCDFNYEVYDKGSDYLKLYSGVIGGLGIVQFKNISIRAISLDNVENNFYVEKESIKQCGSGIDCEYDMLFFKFWGSVISASDIENCMMACENLGSISLEVLDETVICNG